MSYFLMIAILCWFLAKVEEQIRGQVILRRMKNTSKIADLRKPKWERREIAKKYDCWFDEEKNYISFTRHYDGSPYLDVQPREKGKRF